MNTPRTRSGKNTSQKLAQEAVQIDEHQVPLKIPHGLKTPSKIGEIHQLQVRANKSPTKMNPKSPKENPRLPTGLVDEAPKNPSFLTKSPAALTSILKGK